VGYSPFCGRCRQQGHVPEDCTAPPRNFPASGRDYPKNKEVQFQDQTNSRSSRHISHIVPQKNFYSGNVFATTRASKAKQNLSETQNSLRSETEMPKILTRKTPLETEKAVEKEIVQPLTPTPNLIHPNKEMTWKERQERALELAPNQTNQTSPQKSNNTFKCFTNSCSTLFAKFLSNTYKESKTQNI
jgi:hypothetical protein